MIWVVTAGLVAIAWLLLEIYHSLLHLSQQLREAALLLRQIGTKLETIDGLLHDMHRFQQMTPEQQYNSRRLMS